MGRKEKGVSASDKKSGVGEGGDSPSTLTQVLHQLHLDDVLESFHPTQNQKFELRSPSLLSLVCDLTSWLDLYQYKHSFVSNEPLVNVRRVWGLTKHLPLHALSNTPAQASVVLLIGFVPCCGS